MIYSYNHGKMLFALPLTFLHVSLLKIKEKKEESKSEKNMKSYRRDKLLLKSYIHELHQMFAKL